MVSNVDDRCTAADDVPDFRNIHLHQPQGVSPRFLNATSNAQRKPDANAFRLIAVARRHL